MSAKLKYLRTLCKPGRSDWAYARDREEALAVLPALLAVAEAADKLRKARDERRQRARDLQQMAAAARAGGPSGARVLTEYDRAHPVVWDVGDVTEEICEALEALDEVTP